MIRGFFGGNDAQGPSLAEQNLPAQNAFNSGVTWQQGENRDVYGRQLQDQRVNSQTDFGSKTWTQDASGNWVLSDMLDPAQQGLLGQQRNVQSGLMGQMGQKYGQSQDFAQLLPEYQKEALQYSGGPFDRQKAEDAYYNSASRYAKPRMEEQMRALQERLVSQGMNIGDKNYLSSISNLRQDQDMAEADMRDRAFIGGGAEASSELARILQARGAASGEALDRITLAQQDRDRPAMELARAGQAWNPQASGTQATYGTPNLQPVDYLTASQNFTNSQIEQAQGAQNASAAAKAGKQQGMMGLAGSAATAAAIFF
jgi:hypothetical protein